MGLTFFDELISPIEPSQSPNRKASGAGRPRKASEKPEPEPDRITNLETAIAELTKAIIPSASNEPITAPVIGEQNPIVKKVDDMLAQNAPESETPKA